MHPLAKLAKDAVETYVRQGRRIPIPAGFENELMQRKAGAFVSLHIGEELRGCIGTYLPTKDNIALEIISNAILAATDDPRFNHLAENDLARLSYEVYILEKPQTVKSLDELDPKKFGVIVFGKQSHRSALLLPDLEGIETIEQQLACVTQKAGINPAQEKLAIQKFRAQKFK